MKIRVAIFCLFFVLSPEVFACPTGMQFNGSGCSPPYEYTGWDLLRDRRAAIDAIGSEKPPARGLSAEEARKLQEDMKQLEEDKDRKRQELGRGVWGFDSRPTPDGDLCVAFFSKYAKGQGGIVTIMGFKGPTNDAWLIFHGTDLPKPSGVKKIDVMLQQNEEAAVAVKAFNYSETRGVGTIMFAVPGLRAIIDGMSDTQRFRISQGGKVHLDIEWHTAKAIIEKLKQCAG